MVNFRSIPVLLAAATLANVAYAHPGETPPTPQQLKREGEIAHAAHLKAARALKNCASDPEFVARRDRVTARRAEAARVLREKRGISHKPMTAKRDQAALEKWAAISHDQSELGYDLDTPNDVIFAGNATCALVEETTIGPYWVEGEVLKADISDGEEGVDLHLVLQFVDIADCSPVSDIIADIWHASAMGVYSGVSSTGQGGLNTTFHRGGQVTDVDGVTEFDTKFPGHYRGRATHIHVLTVKEATILPNQTWDGGVATHIGQFFWDQDLISAVETVEPYISNTQELTENLSDGIAAGEATDEYDIFLDYALLGDAASDGILSWILVGVDNSADYNDNVQAAAHWYEGGGVDNGNSGPPGGPGGPPPTSSAAA
ncbi:putative gpi anchored protein [Eutypa lata UCREL1]|uniref:Putative gpi anchored protein n=1 Tax=Eutypa lata (strain UCR-EL1) TaxID=1287681 RepID=M7ST87_EUTLA|nr:putative gpi anchored protein [Eutypa lata UCREL1]